MTSTEVSLRGGGAVGPVGRLDVRDLMRQYLPAFKAVEPWRDRVFIPCSTKDGEITEVHPWKAPDNAEKAVTEAIAIREAIGSYDAVWEVSWEMYDLMQPPPEDIVRAMLIVMLSVLKSKPTEGADIYIDAMVFELTEPETGNPICAPAIAAAVRETWNEQTFAPSVHELMARARKHQKRIEMIDAQLSWLIETYNSARDVLQKYAPEKLPPPPQREVSDDDDEDLPF
jgi:hypothetical protein